MPPGIPPAAAAPAAPFSKNQDSGFTPRPPSSQSVHQTRDIQVGTGESAAATKKHTPTPESSTFSSNWAEEDFKLDFSLVEVTVEDEVFNESEVYDYLDSATLLKEQRSQLGKLFEIRIGCEEILKGCNADELEDFTNIILKAAGLPPQKISNTSHNEFQDKVSPLESSNVFCAPPPETLDEERRRTLVKIQNIINTAERRVRNYEDDGDIDFQLTLTTAINSHTENIKTREPIINIADFVTTIDNNKAEFEDAINTLHKVNYIIEAINSESLSGYSSNLISEFFIDIERFTFRATEVFNEANAFNFPIPFSATTSDSSRNGHVPHAPFEIFLTKFQIDSLRQLHFEMEDVLSFYSEKLTDESIFPQSKINVNFVNTVPAAPHDEVVVETFIQLLRYSRFVPSHPTPLNQFYCSHANEINVFFHDH